VEAVDPRGQGADEEKELWAVDEWGEPTCVKFKEQIVEINFKFEIGQIVTTKESLAAWVASRALMKPKDIEFNNSMGKHLAPIRLTIGQREMEECPGGIQLHYNCMYWASNGYMGTKFNEIMLVEYPADF
jgi:hypothetical protein